MAALRIDSCGVYINAFPYYTYIHFTQNLPADCHDTFSIKFEVRTKPKSELERSIDHMTSPDSGSPLERIPTDWSSTPQKQHRSSSLLQSTLCIEIPEMDHSSSSFPRDLPPQDLAGEAVHLVSESVYHHNHVSSTSSTLKPDPDPDADLTLAVVEDAHSLQPLQSAVGDLTAYAPGHRNAATGPPPVDAYHPSLVRVPL